MRNTQAETTTPTAPRELPRRSEDEGALAVRDGRCSPFFMIDNAVLDRYGAMLSGNEFKVYAALARHANAERHAWPSYAGMAKRLGMDRSTVMRAIKRLEELGLLRREYQRDAAGDPTSNLYTLLPVPEVVAATPLPSSTGETGVVAPTPPPSGADATRVVAPVLPGWLHPRHQGSGTHATQTIPNQKDLSKKTHSNNTHPAASEGEGVRASHPYQDMFGEEWRKNAGAWWSEVNPLLDATWLWGVMAGAPVVVDKPALWQVFKGAREEVERRLSIKDSTSQGFVRSPRGFAAKVLLSTIAKAAAAVPPVPAAPQSPTNPPCHTCNRAPWPATPPCGTCGDCGRYIPACGTPACGTCGRCGTPLGGATGPHRG